MPLGLLPGMRFEEREAVLQAGETVLLHSDGLAGTWKWVEKDLTLVTISGASHFVQQDAAELVTTTMKWWLASRSRK